MSLNATFGLRQWYTGKQAAPIVTWCNSNFSRFEMLKHASIPKPCAMSLVTKFLNEVNPADSQSAERLLPIVYRELRQLAAARLRREAPGQTLQATALVHEVYMRLFGSGSGTTWHSRAQFFAAASEAMRRIVIDNCRRKKRIKHGGAIDRDDIDLAYLACEQPKVDLLSINEALEALEAVDPKKALLVKLRYFAGLTMPEAAEVLEVSVPTAERNWRYSRAWLANYLQDRL